MHLPAELPTPSNSGQLLSSKQKAKAVAVKTPEDVPLSPSHSCSMSSISSKSSSSQVPGLDTLSPEELKSLYKKAHIELRTKEKDIKLAAELGRSLLENNLELKARYEAVRQQRRASPELIIRPSTSILTRSRDTHETASRWLQRVDSPTSDDGTMRLISTQQAHDAIVKMLNEKNDAIQSSLDSTLADLEIARASSKEQIRKLQNEMERLQRELENAEQTIENIDRQRQQDSYRQRAATPTSDLLDAQLQEQMNELESENQRLLAAKAAAQSKLDQVTHSLSQWQQRIADYETIDNQCKEKQLACQHQVDEIARLTGHVEEYRSQLQRYRDNDLSSNDDEKVLLENHDTEELRPPALQPSMSTQTNLLSELERAWTKEHGNALSSPAPSPTISSVINRRVTQQLPSINNDGADGNEEYVSLLSNDIRDAWSKELDAVHPLMSRMPSNKHYSSASSRSATTDADYPAFDPPSTTYSSSFRPPSEKRCYASGESLYAQLSLSGATGGRGRAFMAAAYHPRKRRLYHQQHQQSGILFLVIHKIWGWYRFSLILFLAVLINLWQGPDAILEK